MAGPVQTHRCVRYGEKLFMDRGEGVFIVSKTVYENVLSLKKDEAFLHAKEVLGAGSKGVSGEEACMICLSERKEVSYGVLFPVCKEEHFFICPDCLESKDEEAAVRCSYSSCKEEQDGSAMERYRGVVSEYEEKALAIQPIQAPDSFLLTKEITDEKVLLTAQTTVSLQNIAVSGELFSMLLSKTKVRVGESLSITSHFNSEDCKSDKRNTGLVLENIGNMLPNSIDCAIKEVSLHDSILINILSKLKPGEDGEIRSFNLSAKEECQVVKILEEANRSVNIGGVRALELKGYAVNVLPRLKIGERNEPGRFVLYADEEDHVTEILKEPNRSIGIGKAKEIELWHYAVSVLPKLKIMEDSEMRSFLLQADRGNQTARILSAPDRSICIGRTKSMKLNFYAVDILPKLRTRKDSEMDMFLLYAKEKDHVTEILRADDRGICIGKTKEMRLNEYAVAALPKLKTGENNDIGRLVLFAYENKAARMIGTDDRSIRVGRIETMELTGYAVSILPKLKMSEENEMDCFVLHAYGEDDIAQILEAGYRSIDIGKIKTIRLTAYAANVLPKLKIGEDNEMDVFVLYAEEEGQIAKILEEPNRSIGIGRVKNIKLVEYAVDVLPKLRVSGDSEMEGLELCASQKGNISETLKTADRSIGIGRTKSIKLEYCAVDVLPKLKIGEDNETRHFVLYAEEEPTGILETADRSIGVGRVKEMELTAYAVGVLPTLRVSGDNEMETFVLDAPKKEHAAKALSAPDRSICIGRTRTIKLTAYAVNVLLKLNMGEGSEVKSLGLYAGEEDHLIEILAVKDRSICVGGMRTLELVSYAANVLPKLKIREENELETFVLCASKKEHITGILSAADGSIGIGRIKRGGLDVPGETKPKLKYVLADEEEVADDTNGETTASTSLLNRFRS
ncbi:MAG: uncharacterized protein A8A55_2519 [Amphiamblys sp. WSBS2006]|nr:MAG: uncharacterized protein A8A55_2519 [Amphiamblys sp. WSBS2006]